MVLSSLLKGMDLQQSQLQYAVHPGGPKILEMLGEALGIDREQLGVSWELLSQVGNSSGSSNLALLHRELMAHSGSTYPESTDSSTSLSGTPSKEHIVCIGIGPGLAIEVLLVKRLA